MSATIVSRGRGKSKASLALIDAATRILVEIQPASIRAVCYRLFVEGVIPSMSKANTNKVGSQLVWAREQGLLPWDWIVDETRAAERVTTWDDPESIINAAVRGYRKDYWTEQPEWIEVWSEKGTIRGSLAPVLEKYGVTFRVMHGYGSATSLHDIAVESLTSIKTLKVLYVGDWDPSGMQMSEVDLPGRLERYDGVVEIERVALSASDVRYGTDLPSFDLESKSKDPRYQWFLKRYGCRCWELDALSPVILRRRVEAKIISMLDMDAWNHAIKVEAAEVESMSSILTHWKSISRPAQKYSPEG